ncbi:hypothetical protein D5F11_009475 [Siminovitchia terrae]|uniref:Uncharacterized protein n=1 Tax=Siminovitchia terrae TaxID=1914933 RepID=A0A429X968_SIMTE|nr:hypothetical protein [Siminovitchia terrae]RST59932.1 hypothetical protein D5F11_009475 [Siminovitchia terrae]
MIENKISTSYKNDIQKFKIFCDETGRKEDEQSFLYYMYNSIENERVKKTTWEKRVVAIRKYLTVTLGIHFDDSIRSKIGTMRTMYHEGDKMDLIQVKGKSPINKEKLLAKIRQLDTRARAICLVNLTTANRPSEMVLLKVGHFDLDAI